MPVTIGFQGLCAIVSEKQDVTTSTSLDVLVVDTKKAGLKCLHVPVLILPTAGLKDPQKLTTTDLNGNSTLSLAGRQLRFIPIGPKAAATGFKAAAAVTNVPEMKRACGIGTVHADCFATPPTTKPIAGRIQLPPGGQLSSGNQSPVQWSFSPKIGTCYHGRFAFEVLYDLPAATAVTIMVEALDGSSQGELTLTASSGKVAVNNVCSLDPAGTPSDDALVYYKLLDPPFSGAKRPKTWQTDNCTESPKAAPGIGCVPFLMSRS